MTGVDHVPGGHMVVERGQSPWIRFKLGDESSSVDNDKINWCRNNIEPGEWVVWDVGFLYSEYVLLFKHAGDATAFCLRWGGDSG